MFSTTAAGMTMIAIGPFDLSIYSIADIIAKRTGGAETRFMRGSFQMIGKLDKPTPRKFIAQSREAYVQKRDLSLIEDAGPEIRDWLKTA